MLWRGTVDRRPPAEHSATGRRGRRQGLSVDVVIATAVEVADADGLDAVTMRRVAQALGVVPMTLYTYVPDKAALLDLMLDQLYLTMPRQQTHGQSWRARLTAVAAENKEFFDRHPWATEVSRSRPPLGPGLMAKYEHELRAFDGTGLDEVTTDAALTFLLGFVQSSARAAADARKAIEHSAQTDAQWWAANGPRLAVYLDPAAYPTAARVGPVAGEALQSAFNPDHAYEFGLQRVLDGLAVLIQSRAATSSRRAEP
ncbi:MAG TPA: TetR/AcrR family transcriptional regulator C-terminal domain-containing protein [Actinoplanes sp.]|nr:TetR/AcrR family transcriptional regulator C-terminal domain-containing protein [Actinoplanes sp.]